MKVEVIAEAGSSHDRSLSKAIRLIEAAKEAGADWVKFQYWSSAERMVQRRKADAYLDAYTRYQLPREWLPELAIAAKQAGIGFACSSYLPEDVWRIAEYAQLLKISSFESGDRELLVSHIGPVKAGRRCVISLGMGETERTADEWLIRGLGMEDRGRVKFLACTSAYPAAIDQLNLRRLGPAYNSNLGPYRQQFDGFSDHSPAGELWTGALSAAAGAELIERHFRLLETSEENPDWLHSMTPANLKGYVSNIRRAEAALGSGETKAQSSEGPMLQFRVS